jgi:chloramphenicol 3-O-phosphotransferase
MINDPEGLSVHEGVITRGRLFTPLYEGFLHAVAALARSGVDVLIDDLTLDGLVDQQRWNNALQGLDVCWVGVRCAPQIPAEREPRRGLDYPASLVIRRNRFMLGSTTTLKSTRCPSPPRRSARDCRRACAKVVIDDYDRIQRETNTPSHISLDARGGNPSSSMGVLTNRRRERY